MLGAILRSPRGLNAVLPNFGPSAATSRFHWLLVCMWRNRFNHFSISLGVYFPLKAFNARYPILFGRVPYLKCSYMKKSDRSYGPMRSSVSCEIVPFPVSSGEIGVFRMS